MYVCDSVTDLSRNHSSPSQHARSGALDSIHAHVGPAFPVVVGSKQSPPSRPHHRHNPHYPNLLDVWWRQYYKHRAIMTHIQKVLGLRGLSRRLSEKSHMAFMSTAQPAAASSSKFYDVPEGHSDSDLSQIACNIGLNRRRELTLGAAGQTTVYVGGTPHRLADLLKVNILPCFFFHFS